VTLRYRPWTLTAGAIVSVAALIAVAGAAVLAAVRARQRRRSERAEG